MKALSVLLLFLVLTLSLFACGENAPDTEHSCAECADGNGDGKCDVCDALIQNSSDGTEDGDTNPGGTDNNENEGEAVMPDFPLFLIKEGKADFQFVISDNLSEIQRNETEEFLEKLRLCGVSGIKTVSDTAQTACEVEVLLGDVMSRGDRYCFDPYVLGPCGYSIKLVDKKLVVTAGGEEGFSLALDRLENDIFGITEDMGSISEIIIESDPDIEFKTEDYKIKSLKINGRDISEYCISADPSDKISLEIAEHLREVVYNLYGKRLKITVGADINAITVSQTARSGNEGFYFTVSEKGIIISCEYSEKFKESALKVFESLFNSGKNEIDITSEHSCILNVRDIRYSDFGAIGDAIFDDTEAIVRTHEYANEHGHRVVGDKDAKYRINSHGSLTAIIKTDTDWNGATFIIDYTSEKSGAITSALPLFKIASDTPPISLSGEEMLSSLSKGEENIGFKPGYTALVVITDLNKKQFIRYGSSDLGQPQSVAVMVDAEGNIDPLTPLTCDFTNISRMNIYSADDKPITVQNANFLFRYGSNVNENEYLFRGIVQERSNSLLTKITTQIEKKDYTGDVFCEFIRTKHSYGVTVSNCYFDYPTEYCTSGSELSEQELNRRRIFSGELCVGISWKKLTLSSFYNDLGSLSRTGTEMQSVSCRNIVYENNLLFSFNALYSNCNVLIKSCELERIKCTGEGDLTVEDTIIYSHYSGCVVELNSEIGAGWLGEALFKDCTVICARADMLGLFKIDWYNHNFGIKNGMPHSVTVDNLSLDNGGKTCEIALVIGNVADHAQDIRGEELSLGVENSNPYSMTEIFTVRNNKSGLIFTVSTALPFTDTTFVNE